MSGGIDGLNMELGIGVGKVILGSEMYGLAGVDEGTHVLGLADGTGVDARLPSVTTVVGVPLASRDLTNSSHFESLLFRERWLIRSISSATSRATRGGGGIAGVHGRGGAIAGVDTRGGGVLLVIVIALTTLPLGIVNVPFNTVVVPPIMVTSGLSAWLELATVALGDGTLGSGSYKASKNQVITIINESWFFYFTLASEQGLICFTTSTTSSSRLFLFLNCFNSSNREGEEVVAVVVAGAVVVVVGAVKVTAGAAVVTAGAAKDIFFFRPLFFLGGMFC